MKQERPHGPQAERPLAGSDAPLTPSPGTPLSWPRLLEAPQPQKSHPGPPAPLAPHRPGHLESLPAFALPEASSPDEESSSSDSSDCRSSTMERRGPGRAARKGRKGGQGSARALQCAISSTPRATWSVTPRFPKPPTQTLRGSPSARWGLPPISPSTAPRPPLPKGSSGSPHPLPSGRCSQASGPWPEAGPQGPSIAKAKGAALFCCRC